VWENSILHRWMEDQQATDNLNRSLEQLADLYDPDELLQAVQQQQQQQQGSQQQQQQQQRVTETWDGSGAHGANEV